MFPWHMTKLKPESPRSILLHLGVLFIVLDSSDVEDVIASVVDEGSGMIEGERKDIVGMRKDVEVRENSNIEGIQDSKEEKTTYDQLVCRRYQRRTTPVQGGGRYPNHS
jgi:hypothetical protein